MPLLYMLGHAFYFLGYRVAGYRKKVTRANLQAAFPEMSQKERLALERRFYRHLAMVSAEILKAFSIPPAQLRARHTLHDDPRRPLRGADTPALLLSSHCGNWEWASLMMAEWLPRPFLAVYMKLASARSDEMMRQMRARTGAVPARMERVYREMTERRAGNPVAGILADQTPLRSQNPVWFNWLHRPTPFFSGPAKLARKMKCPIYIGYHRRVRKGHYAITLELLIEDPTQYTEPEIMAIYARKLEAEIRNRPAEWLWTHKRWKHTPTPQDEIYELS